MSKGSLAHAVTIATLQIYTLAYVTGAGMVVEPPDGGTVHRKIIEENEIVIKVTEVVQEDTEHPH